jgi:hypothetical protein
MTKRNSWRITSRVLAAVIGCWLATAGATALLAVLMVLWSGAARPDALVASSMVAYLLWVVLMLWCFAERRLGRVWLVLIAAAIATHALALWIEPILPLNPAQS